jgi:hypothetical protein
MSHFYDVTTRFWDELIAQSAGPLAFRFALQLGAASLLAIHDGYKDARDGRTPYLRTILHSPRRRKTRLLEGLRAIVFVLLLSAMIGVIYQTIAMKGFHPIQLMDIIILLAFVPYMLVRGPAQRFFRWRLQLLDYPNRRHSFRHG